MLKLAAFIALLAGALAWASGLPEVYEPEAKPEPRPEPKPPEAEEFPRVEKPGVVGPGGELHDVRVVLYVGGVAPSDKETATAKLLPTLERRAAGLAKRHNIQHGEGESRITVELFGTPDPARALQILVAPGLLEFQAVAEAADFEQVISAAGWPTAELLLYEHRNVVLVAADDKDGLAEALRGKLKPGERVLWTRRLEGDEGEVYKAALATGDGMAVTGVIDAVAVVDAVTGEPSVNFDLSDRDGVIFSGLTARHLGEGLAVVFDDELFYTARVKEQTFKRAAVVGEMDEQRALDIALLLSSGSLPATLTPVEYYVDGESRPIPKPSK
jgi:SecD/SecF fusion protein